MNTQPEQWKAIAECNGEYYISDYGRVKSFKFGKERILKPQLVGYKPNQYYGVNLSKTNNRKKEQVHRLVALAFILNPENKPQVNHKDGNKLNNHIDNLEWNTCKENIQHAWDTGLYESKRLVIIESRSKAVIDTNTGKKYKSLKLACQDVGENISTNKTRAHKKLKTQRFFYINENGNG